MFVNPPGSSRQRRKQSCTSKALQESHHFRATQRCGTNLCDWCQPYRVQDHGYRCLECFMYHELPSASHEGCA